MMVEKIVPSTELSSEVNRIEGKTNLQMSIATNLYLNLKKENASDEVIREAEVHIKSLEVYLQSLKDFRKLLNERGISQSLYAITGSMYIDAEDSIEFATALQKRLKEEGRIEALEKIESFINHFAKIIELIFSLKKTIENELKSPVNSVVVEEIVQLNENKTETSNTSQEENSSQKEHDARNIIEDIEFSIGSLENRSNQRDVEEDKSKKRDQEEGIVEDKTKGAEKECDTGMVVENRIYDDVQNESTSTSGIYNDAVPKNDANSSLVIAHNSHSTVSRRGGQNVCGLKKYPITTLKFRSKTEFFAYLVPLDIGSVEFTTAFEKFEFLYFNDESFKVDILKDGVEFKNKMRQNVRFENVYLMKNAKGLGMKIPDDLSWKTVLIYFKRNNETNIVINSRAQGKKNKRDVKLSLRKLLKIVKNNTDINIAYNMLSYEFTGSSLDEHFEAPEFVREKCMVTKLAFHLKEALKNIEKLLKETKNEKDRKEISAKQDHLKNQMNQLPNYHKYLIVSMKNSFSDVHVDPAGSAVFYHVVEGKKIFFIAEPTTENMKIYEEHQKENAQGWAAEALSGQWTRVEINKGETAIIPPGYLHFVYTPVDSLVIGGNFLMAQDIKRQFQIANIEERSLKENLLNETNLYQHFRSVMFSYAENVFLEDLQFYINTKIGINEDLKLMGAVFLHELQMNQEAAGWFTLEQRTAILEQIQKLCPKSNRKKYRYEPDEIQSLTLISVAKKRKNNTADVKNQSPIPNRRKR